MDAAIDRIERDRLSRHESWIEAVRIGTIFAHDGKAHMRWVRTRDHAASGAPGLSGAALERTVLGLAASHPDLVAMG